VVGPPLVIAIVFGLLGIVLMLLQWRANPAYFKRPVEVAKDDSLDLDAPPLPGTLH
jgi:hypothetical protein